MVAFPPDDERAGVGGVSRRRTPCGRLSPTERRPCGSLCSSAPSPTLPGRHTPIDRLGQHFRPHVAGDVRLYWTRTNVSTRAIRCPATSYGDKGTGAQSVSSATNSHSQRPCADVGPRESSDVDRCASVALAHTGSSDARRAPRCRGARASGRRPGAAVWDRRDGTCARLRVHAPAGRVDRLHPTVHDSSFCRVPRPRCGAATPAGVDLFSGQWRDGGTAGAHRQLERAFGCLGRA